MAPVTPLARIELSGDRWIRLHLASVNQQLAIDAMEVPTTNKGWRERFETFIGWLRDATEEKSWPGDVGDGLAMQELETLVSRWMVATEDVAFPLAPESSSETQSAEPPSEAPTAGRSKSRRRRSSGS